MLEMGRMGAGGGGVFVNQDDLFERVIFPSQCLKFILKITRL